MRKTFYILLFCLLPFVGFSKESYNVLSFPQAEFLTSNTTRIPFQLVDHLIVIEAQLLDQKGNFIIDTGSESLILNKNHFKGYHSNLNTPKQTTGIFDFIDNPLEKRLKEFIIKDLIIQNKLSDVIDLSHIESSKKMHLLGIIGYDILKDFEIFIDMHLNQITLSKINNEGDKLDDSVYLEKIIDSVDFKLKNHTIVIKANVNGKILKFGLDTAAEYNQLNKKIDKVALKQFFPKRRLQLIGASGQKIEVLAGKLYRVKLTKTIYYGPMHTILTNLNQMNNAFGTKLDGVLGYEFFRQQRTIINYKKEKLYFVKNPLYKQ
ncbi:retropepsin-like domain-containing protein [Psychroserpens ponticola]|uniref:Retropepsin-like domain-containing protein n=1 Tax=Psychroserpens ponticola TaxID=2932268 RepID=A0ABY7S0M7_9FLAO|nr:retropepsin-like domain-containing protein [Psychroserpens ponticola]WCO02939.1 retropepsin-like domain-containing protein [Psychroserpens ponticola]